MKTITMTREQLAELARVLAKSFGYDNTDVLVMPGPLAEVRINSAWPCFVAPSPELVCPLWRHFEGPVRDLLGRVGTVAGVQFMIVDQKADAA